MCLVKESQCNLFLTIKNEKNVKIRLSKVYGSNYYDMKRRNIHEGLVVIDV